MDIPCFELLGMNGIYLSCLFLAQRLRMHNLDAASSSCLNFLVSLYQQRFESRKGQFYATA